MVTWRSSFWLANGCAAAHSIRFAFSPCWRRHRLCVRAVRLAQARRSLPTFHRGSAAAASPRTHRAALRMSLRHQVSSSFPRPHHGGGSGVGEASEDCRRLRTGFHLPSPPPTRGRGFQRAFCTRDCSTSSEPRLAVSGRQTARSQQRVPRRRRRRLQGVATDGPADVAAFTKQVFALFLRNLVSTSALIRPSSAAVTRLFPTRAVKRATAGLPVGGFAGFFSLNAGQRRLFDRRSSRRRLARTSVR